MRQSAHDMLRTLFTMAAAVEARDPYTGGHLWRVSQYAHLLAEQAGLSSREQARIALGGFLHDIGKIGIPDAILNKPGPLSDAEYAQLKTHPGIGRQLLRDHPLATLIIDAVEAHHERPDRRGYPRGIGADRIPVEARIVGIADAFDAMTSSRPYRAGMPSEKALGIIRANLGTQFDHDLGEHFLALGEQGALEHIIGHSEPDVPLQDCPRCGPTIVVRRRQQPGEAVYCRACGGEAILEPADGGWRIRPTGNRADPAAVATDVDNDLIERLVASAEQALARPGLLGRVFRRGRRPIG